MNRAPFAAIVLAALATAAPVDALLAQAKSRPITREWQCDNGRIVLVNYHPRRIREPAWLTYLGNYNGKVRFTVDAGTPVTVDLYNAQK